MATRCLIPTKPAPTYTYDGNGNRLTQKDAKQYTTTFTYDKLNRLETMEAEDQASTIYGYDEVGNRTSEIDANGQLTTHIYDDLNRLGRTTYSNLMTPTGDDLEQIDYDYDENDNLQDITETYSGDTGVRLTIRSYDDFDRALTVMDPEGHILTYNYDLVGNRLTLTAPERLTRYTYDALNRVESVITPQGATEYDYDLSSRLTDTTYPTGAKTVTIYDDAGRVETIEHTQPGTPVASYAYLYDTNGNRTQETETRGGVELITTYDYDLVDRLKETTSGDHHTLYTYDPASNRQSELRTAVTDDSVVMDRSYTYNTRNQLTEFNDGLDPVQAVTFDYDANGNRITKSTTSQTETYVYDSRNQVRRLTQGGSSLGEFLYDWQGLRVRKQTPSETRRYVYDDQSVLLTTDDAGTIDSHYIYGPGRLLALDHVTQGPQYYLFDALGSVVGLSKPDGALQSRYDYDAWGNVEDEAGDSANRFGFTGHELDSESGLYYAKARYYDPQVGLFLSQDPVLGDPLTPMSLHRYLYANQNPTKYTDPTGRCAEPATFLLCAAAVAATAGIVTDFLVQEYESLSSGRTSGLGDFVANDYNGKRGLTHGLVGGISGATGGAASIAGASTIVAVGTGILVDSALDTGTNALIDDREISFNEFGKNVAVNTLLPGLGAIGNKVFRHVKRYFKQVDDIALPPQPRISSQTSRETSQPVGTRTVDGSEQPQSGRTMDEVEVREASSNPGGEIKEPEGPFHRMESPTQTSEIAKKIQDSSELWGRSRRGSDIPQVQAYEGPLPEGKSGIEFSTPVKPDAGTAPGQVRWTGPRDGVRVEGDYAKIPVDVNKNTQ